MAVRFAQAIQAGSGGTACDLLTENAQSAASGATGVSCDEAILNVKETSTDVSSTQVWGDAAQVRVGDDVLFLRKQNDGWRVRAAGCQRKSNGVYDCDVEG
ncbi:MAG: hypothetical protein JWM76_3203 [Pseudonocardiales bacterium]|nr:hypothetical protein [Pseudonocardiales bacterium]